MDLGDETHKTFGQDYLAVASLWRRTEVASGAAARALQITTLQLPESSVSPRLRDVADVRKNAVMF